MVGAGAESATFKLILAIHLNVRYNYCQHLLVNINSGYPV